MQTLLPLCRPGIYFFYKETAGYFFYSEKITIFFIYTDAEPLFYNQV